MPSPTPTPATKHPAQPRLLSGSGRPGGDRAATEATNSTATVPLGRQRPEPAPAAAPDALPRWVKGFVIGGVLLAVAMPAAVLVSRSMLVQEVLAEQSGSKAAMVCTSGDGRARDDSSVIGWLFGGSYFHCGDWETREARLQRERDQDQANFLARERARQGAR